MKDESASDTGTKAQLFSRQSTSAASVHLLEQQSGTDFRVKSGISVQGFFILFKWSSSVSVDVIWDLSPYFICSYVPSITGGGMNNVSKGKGPYRLQFLFFPFHPRAFSRQQTGRILRNGIGIRSVQVELGNVSKIVGSPLALALSGVSMSVPLVTKKRREERPFVSPLMCQLLFDFLTARRRRKIPISPLLYL